MNQLASANDQVRLVWILAVLVLVAGALFLVKPAEQQLSDTDFQGNSFLQQALSAERALQDQDRVEEQAQRIRQELSTVTLRGTTSESTQALLGDLQRAAARDQLTVLALKPAMAMVAAPPAAASATQVTRPYDPLGKAQTDDFDISVRGTYRDCVSFFRDLSHMPTLTRVVSAQLDRANDTGVVDETPTLDATIHVQTIRLDRTALP